MKKFILSIAVIGTIAFAFAACQPTAQDDATSTDSTTVAVDTTSTDTAAVIVVTNDTASTVVSQ